MDPRQEYHPYNPYIYAQSGGYPFLLQRQQSSSNFLSPGTGALHSPALIAPQPLSSLPSPYSYHQPHQQRRPDDGRILYAGQAPNSPYLPDRSSQHFNFAAIQPAMPSIRVSDRVFYSGDYREAPAFQHQDHRLGDSYVHGGVKRERSSVIGSVQGSHLRDRSGEISYVKRPRLEEEVPSRNVAGRDRSTMNSPYSYSYTAEQREASNLPRLRSTVHIKSSSPAHSSSSNVEGTRSHRDEVHFSPRRSSQPKNSILSRLQFGKPAWKKKCKQRGDEQVSASSEFSQTNVDGAVDLDISFEANVLRAKEKLTSTDGGDDSNGTIEPKGNENKVENLDEQSVRPSIAKKKEKAKVIVSSTTVPSIGSKEAKVSENGIQENLGKKVVVKEGKVDLVSNSKSCLKGEEHKVVRPNLARKKEKAKVIVSSTTVPTIGSKEAKVSENGKEVVVKEGEADLVSNSKSCLKDEEQKLSETGMNLEETLVNVEEHPENTSEISNVPAKIDIEEGEIPGEAYARKESDVSDLSKSMAKSGDLNSPNAMILSKKKKRRPQKNKKLGAFNSPSVDRNEEVDVCKGVAPSVENDPKEGNTVAKRDPKEGTVIPSSVSQINDQTLQIELKKSNQPEILPKGVATEDPSSPTLNAVEEIQANILPNPSAEEGPCSVRSVDGDTKNEDNVMRSLSVFPSNGYKFMQSEPQQDLPHVKKNYTCPVPGCKENGHRIIAKPQMLVQSFSFGKEIQKSIQHPKNQRKVEHFSGVPTIESRELDRLFSFGVHPQIKEARQLTCNPQDGKQCFPGSPALSGATAAKKKTRVRKVKVPINCVDKKKWTWKRNEVATPVPPLVGGTEPGDICKGKTSTYVPAKGVLHSVEISNSDLKQVHSCDVEKSRNQSEIAPKVVFTVDSLSLSVEEDSCSKETEKRDAKEGSPVQPLLDSLPTQEVCELPLESNASGSSSVSLMNDKTLQSNVEENVIDINMRPRMVDHMVSSAKVIDNGNQDLKNVKELEQSAGVTVEMQEVGQPFCNPLEGNSNSRAFALEKMQEASEINSERSTRLFSFGVQSKCTTEISPHEADDSNMEKVLDDSALDPEVQNRGRSDRLFSFGMQPKQATKADNSSVSNSSEKLTDNKGILGQKPEAFNVLPSHQTSQRPRSFKKPSDSTRRNIWRRTENGICVVPYSRVKMSSPEKSTETQSSYVRKGNSLIRKPSSVVPSTNSASDQAALDKTSGPERERKGKVSPTEVFEPRGEERGSLSVDSQPSEAIEENGTNILVVGPATLPNKETARANNSASGLAVAPIVFNYRRIRNKLIRDLSSSGSRSSSKLTSSKSTAYELKKATMSAYKSSRFSLVWTLNGKESKNHEDHNPLKRRKVLPYLFPWKRTALQGNVFTRRSHVEKHPSLLTRKLQQLRRKSTPASYTSGRGIVRHSLKWSKSMEKRSRKEAASTIAERQERGKKEKTPLTDLAAKKGVGYQCERVFRVGTLRYKMDPSRRTLIRIPDEQKTPLERKPVLEGKIAIVPRRLSIGNDEYVRVGNGNQLVRDPKKLVRILASEKIRWSLHTARQRSIRKQRYCQFFTRFGRCNKEEGRCPYIHDPTKVAICSKFLKGLCFEPNCKLTHKVIPERMPDCSYFLEGLCTNSSCPYRHVNVNPKASLCKGFLRGYCRDGDECRKKHSYACPQFEASGKCPQGSSCKLHHKKAILPQKRKRVWAETHSWGRYFGGVPDQNPLLPVFSVGSEAKGEDEADVFFQEGRFTEFISLNNDNDNDDDGKRLALDSSSSKRSSTHLLDQVVKDDDAIIKPVGIMRR